MNKSDMRTHETISMKFISPKAHRNTAALFRMKAMSQPTPWTLRQGVGTLQKEKMMFFSPENSASGRRGLQIHIRANKAKLNHEIYSN